MRRKIAVVALALSLMLTFAASSVSANETATPSSDHKKTEGCGTH